MGVIVSRDANPEIFKYFDDNNIYYIKSLSLEYLYFPINTHPDMQIHFIDTKTAVSSPDVYDYYRKMLPESVTLIKGSTTPGRTYPQDCAYNVARLGKRVIGNLSYTEPKIKEIYASLGYEFINVKQGYTKCNLCIVDENSVITEDEGLNRELSSVGIDVLKIDKGGINLKAFENGFIGGASGFVGKEKLAFSGDLKLHPQYKAIKKFINSKQVDIICLSSTKMEDLGSILYFDN